MLDPELPVLTIDDLGVLRGVEVDDDGGVTVTVTPTYSGCPAMEVIERDVEPAVVAAGFDRRGRSGRVLSPAWTTDWMSAEGRRKLDDYGIAPPGAAGPAGRTAGGPDRADAVGALPAVRQPRHRGDQPLRLDRVQVAVAVPAPAVSRSTTSRRSE